MSTATQAPARPWKWEWVARANEPDTVDLWIFEGTDPVATVHGRTAADAERRAKQICALRNRVARRLRQVSEPGSAAHRLAFGDVPQSSERGQ